MPPTEQKSDTRLEAIVALLEQAPTRKEFVQAFEEVIKVVQQIKKDSNQFVDEIGLTLTQVLQKVQGDHTSSLSDLKGQVNELFISGKLKEIENNLNSKVDEKLATVRNGADGKDGAKGEQGKSIKGDDGSPDTPEEVRDKLESLRGEKRLDASAIRGLEKRLKKIESGGGYAGGGAMGRDIIKSYDLSSSLDGVTVTFNIPANWTILSVSGTSFPFQFRRLVDYTFTPQTITFTSEITPSASLALGQTIEILYVSG